MTTNANVFNPAGTLVGTTPVVSNSPGGPLLSKDLQGPYYVWITVWPNGTRLGRRRLLGIGEHGMCALDTLLTACDGIGGNQKGDLDISSGQTCTLNGSTISGNVTQTRRFADCQTMPRLQVT